MKKAAVKRTLPTRHVITKRISSGTSKTLGFVDKRPMTSFFAVLGAILVLIFVGNFLNKPKPVTPEEMHPVKAVSAYNIGTAPKITVSAQTKKSGVIQVVALTGGIIDKINVQEGVQVSSGTTLLGMSSNYKGENTATIQKQSAATQYQGALATYPKQKETIERQIEKAEKTEDDSEEQREITQTSINETRTLVQQNEDILKILQDSLQSAPADKVLGIKQQIAQYQGTTNQARQTLRSAEYKADEDNPPAEIAKLDKEISKRQLQVQLKQLQISLEVSRLALAVAQINESQLFPTSPFNGTVQRVFVKEKQSVKAGDPLFVLSQVVEDDPITAVAFVSSDVAKRVSRIEPSTLHIGNKFTYTSIPSFVSTEAVQGTLYAVYYPIPEKYSKDVVSEGFISVDMPIGMADTTMVATYVPLDAVYQTREKAYVFVIQGGIAKSRDVQLGQVYGDSVEIVSGLKNGDRVILNRNIIAGDKITVQ
jgi:multidrug efflux pump subunit AcrA (membrane-fusion protein)